MRKNFFVKIYDLFRYKIPSFFKNIWYFRKSLWDFRWWDYHFTLEMMKTSLEIMSDNLEKKGIEVDVPRLKKVAKMKRAIEIMNNMNGVIHIEMAEKELGKLILKDWEFVPEGKDYYSLIDNLTKQESSHNRKIYSRAREIEKSEWKELWDIFEGQHHEKYKKLKNIDWDEWFDGSGMQTWWD